MAFAGGLMNELAEDMDGYSTRILEDFFKDFYYELLKCKEIALRTTKLDAEINYSNEDGKNNEDAGGNDIAANKDLHPLSAHEIKNVPVHAVRAAEEVQTRLKKLFAEQTKMVINLLSPEDLIQFKDAQYAMVALADEVFLTLPWSGSRLWQKFLLESQLFQTQSSGEQVFHKIDELLSRYEPRKRNLACVFFHALALGFKGKFNDAADANVIKHYESRLYAFVYGKNPSTTYDKLIPECYDKTLTSDISSTLPDVKFWTKIVVGVVFVFLIVSYALWYNVAADLYRSLKNIFDQFHIFLSNN
jgi:type VI secretion system protein ImpK